MNNPHQNARMTPLGRVEMVRRIVEEGRPRTVDRHDGAAATRVLARILAIRRIRTWPYTPKTTDVIDKSFLCEPFSPGERVTAWRRAGGEVVDLPRSLYRRTSVAVPMCSSLDFVGQWVPGDRSARPVG